MNRNDLYFWCSFFSMILAVGVHSINYTLITLSDFEMFSRENPVLFILFIVALFIFIYNLIIIINRKKK